eukprot:500324-Prymnesium_polylepis.1
MGCASSKDDPAQAPTGKKAEHRWEPLLAQVEAPFDFEIDATNRIIKIAADRVLREGDFITHIDDVEVRGGSKTVDEALDKARDLHTVLVQRQVVRKKGHSTFTVRLNTPDGKMGIGCTETN